MKKLGIAGLVLAGMLATSTGASAQLCALGLIGVGIYTSVTENRELTQKEAMTCGLVHETPEPKVKKKTRKAKKKPA